MLRETLEREDQEISRNSESWLNRKMEEGPERKRSDPMEAIIQRMEQLEMENAVNAAWRRDMEKICTNLGK